MENKSGASGADVKSFSVPVNGQRRRQPSVASTTTTKSNNNEPAPTSSRSIRSQNQGRTPRTVPADIRSSIASLQSDLSTISLNHTTVSNLENDLNPIKVCSACVEVIVKKVHRFLDKLNGRLIRAQQDRKNRMNKLAKHIGMVKVKIQARRMEEIAQQTELEELASKHKMMEKLLQTTMNNYTELFQRETEHGTRDCLHRQAASRMVTGDKFAYELIKLPRTVVACALSAAAPPVSRLRLQSRTAAAGVWSTKLPHHSVINNRIYRVALGTIFQDVRSKSYRAYLYNNTISPAEKRAQETFKIARQPKLKRPRSHDLSLSVWQASGARRRPKPSHPQHQRVRETRGGIYSKRMVKTSRENQEKHGPKSESESDSNSDDFDFVGNSDWDGTGTKEDLEAVSGAGAKVKAKSNTVEEEAPDEIFGSLPNSFQTFEELYRADRGFFHSIYHRVPDIDKEAGSISRVFSSHEDGLGLYASDSGSSPKKQGSKDEEADHHRPDQEATAVIDGDTEKMDLDRKAVITVHENPGFDVENIKSQDFEGNCEFIEKFLEEQILEHDTSSEDDEDSSVGPLTVDDGIDGDNAEALDGDENEKSNANEDKDKPRGTGKPESESEKEEEDTNEELREISPPTGKKSVTPTSDPGSEAPITPMNYDEDSFEEESNEQPLINFSTEHRKLEQKPESSTVSSKHSLTVEVTSSLGNLADVSSSVSEENMAHRRRRNRSQDDLGRRKRRSKKHPERIHQLEPEAVQPIPSIKDKLKQRNWGELVAKFSTPPSDHSTLCEHASTATLKFPAMKGKSSNSMKEIPLFARQLENIDLGHGPPIPEGRKEPKRLSTSLGYCYSRPPGRNRNRNRNRSPRPKQIKPVFKALTVNENCIEVFDVPVDEPAAQVQKPAPPVMRRLGTKTAILPSKRGIYRHFGPSSQLPKPPSIVVISEPFRTRNSRVDQEHLFPPMPLSSRRVRSTDPSWSVKQGQSHRPAKISTHSLVKAIREFQIKNELVTTTEQSAVSTISIRSGPRQRRNFVGLSTILKPNPAANTRIKSIHNSRKFPHPPTQKEIENEVRRRLVANMAQKQANAEYYRATRYSIRSNMTRRLQDSFIRKLPVPFLPDSVPVPLPPREASQRPRPKPLYPLSLARRQMTTLSAKKSSRNVKPVPRKQLPSHLRYGNFSYWFWPPVCARLPTPTRAAAAETEKAKQLQQQIRQSKIMATTTPSLPGLRRNTIRNF